MTNEQLPRPNWKVGEIIRHKSTGHPYLVQHIYKFVSTLVIDLCDPQTPIPGLFILPRNYDDYATDTCFQVKSTLNPTIEYTHTVDNPFHKKGYTGEFAQI